MEHKQGNWRDWSTEGVKISSLETLEAIRRVLEDDGPIIVEHRFYCAGSSPDWMIFLEYGDLVDYLNKKARPGDSFYLWNFDKVCRDDNTCAKGKWPDEAGRVPKNGAY